MLSIWWRDSDEYCQLAWQLYYIYIPMCWVFQRQFASSTRRLRLSGLQELLEDHDATTKHNADRLEVLSGDSQISPVPKLGLRPSFAYSVTRTTPKVPELGLRPSFTYSVTCNQNHYNIFCNQNHLDWWDGETVNRGWQSEDLIGE